MEAPRTADAMCAAQNVLPRTINQGVRQAASQLKGERTDGIAGLRRNFGDASFLSKESFERASGELRENVCLAHTIAEHDDECKGLHPLP